MSLTPVGRRSDEPGGRRIAKRRTSGLLVGRSRDTASEVGRYDSAMRNVRRLGADLVDALERGAGIDERRRLHRRIDEELRRAIAVADGGYSELFEAAGGFYRSEADPDVVAWRRRLYDALTVRSQHELVQMGGDGVVAPAVARPPTRAASTPHQAGLDFEMAAPGRSPGGPMPL